MTLVDDPGFRLLVDQLRGAPLPPLEMYKDRCLQRRLAVRMRACGAATLTDYAGVIARNPGERGHLLAALTINVTQFFRNPEVWHRLAAAIRDLPGPSGRRLAAWSAGCASGEEAWTLAMVLAMAHPPDRFQVDATDVDPDALATARAGRYPAGSFTEAPAELTARWTAPEGEARGIAAPLRAAVMFRVHDLGRQPAPRDPYDVIVCRNVLIYFSREVQSRLLRGFADALRPGGLLLLGMVESLPAAVRDRFETVAVRERLFRRAA
jgi:chemotaxis methyl-accepting protein methylase